MVGLVFVGAVVGVAIVGVIKLANDPVNAAVTPANLKASIQPTPMPMGHLSGLVVDLDYPGAFNQVAQLKTDNGAAEQYRLGSSGSYRRVITVDVRGLASGRLVDDASYRLRQLQPDVYSQSTRTVAGQAVVVMTKLDKSEDTFFWLHSGKLLIVAITSTEAGDHPDAFLDAMLPTVRWKS